MTDLLPLLQPARHRSDRRSSYSPAPTDRVLAQLVRRPTWRPGYLVVSAPAAVVITAVLVASAVSGWVVLLLLR